MVAVCWESHVLAQTSETKGPVRPGTVTAPFRATPDLRLDHLERLVRERSPELQAAELDVDVAAANVQQSELLPNPTLDFSWNTIPIGPSNPNSQFDGPAIANVPNYGVGLSYTFPLGKRGPRQEQARAEHAAASATLDAVARAKSFELAHLLGELAIATMRREGLRGLVEDAKAGVTIAQARLDAGFGSPLDVDRMRIELSRSEQSLASAEGDVNATLASCAALTGTTCENFASEEEAKQFLDRWTDQMAAAHGDMEQRPDLRALADERRAAEAEERLAHAQAIPDPTVRFGYVHDTYFAAGAQANSLNLAVAIPLPIFDHGQAQARAAQAKEERYTAQRDLRMVAARARIPALQHRVDRQRQRKLALSGEIIPRALGVLKDIKSAAENHLVGIADMIQARRAVSELLLEQADSYGDAFESALQLAAEMPPETGTRDKEPTP